MPWKRPSESVNFTMSLQRFNVNSFSALIYQQSTNINLLENTSILIVWQDGEKHCYKQVEKATFIIVNSVSIDYGWNNEDFGPHYYTTGVRILKDVFKLSKTNNCKYSLSNNCSSFIIRSYINTSRHVIQYSCTKIIYMNLTSFLLN